ncbi:hypothetical protein DEEACLCL_00119 [Salmonella phage CRW-SP2]|nr:hypothetical protein DEEACLCL_00119 [Salmonella phage CRW-SP2]
MSLKTLFKRIFSTAEANIVSGLEKLNSTEKRLNLAASKLCDEIRRLETARVTNKHEVAKLNKTAEQNSNDANQREAILKGLIERGGTPDRAYVQIILHRRRITDALKSKAAEISKSEESINNAIIQLGDRLDTVRANLELIKVQRETNDLGLNLPEDIELSAGITNVDVDALVREIEVHDSAATVNSPTSIEIDNYLANLTK